MDKKIFEHLPGMAYEQHYQDLIRETQNYKLACEAMKSQKNAKVPMALRIIWASIINLIPR
jgi:hypothetical protein